MHTKEELLREVSAKLATGEITVADLKRLSGSEESTHSRLSTMLYYIGGAIVFIGLVILVGTHWDDLSIALRLILTCGVFAVSYIVGAVASRESRIAPLALPFFLISYLLLPISTYVLLDTLHIPFDTNFLLPSIALVYTVWSLISLKVFGRSMFLFFALLFGTGAMYMYIADILKLFVYVPTDVSAHLMMSIGLGHILIGYALRDKAWKGFTQALYTVGLWQLLGAGLTLGGIWNLLYAILLVLVLYASVYLRSRIFLWWGALALMGYLIKITSEYFSNSLGWPLALVIIGFMLIAVGYGTVYVSRRYVKTTTL